MYKLGYKNNNCIGCVKGGMGYWNKVRRDFPAVFDHMAQLEREVGNSIFYKHGKHLWLDELPPNAGHHEDERLPECGVLCQLEESLL
jgi:hypothetical protein